MERERLLKEIAVLIRRLRDIGIEPIFSKMDCLAKLDKWFASDMPYDVSSVISVEAYLDADDSSDVYVDICVDMNTMIHYSTREERQPFHINAYGVISLFKVLTYEHLLAIREFIRDRYEDECEKRNMLFYDD